MKPCLHTLTLLVFLNSSLPSMAAITQEQAAKLPQPAARKIDFTKDIKPILETGCVKCHGRGKAKGDFSIENREALLKGGESGAAVVPGKSAESLLIELVSGLNPDSVMPQKGSKLNADQVGLLRAWIDQGASWDPAVSFAKPSPVNLFPRTPTLPRAGKSGGNPVDRFLDPYFVAHGIKPAKPVSDRVFARRVYLDTIGLLPAPKELDAFVADRRKDKRERLVKSLLSDNRHYAEHWLTFWNDALRNDYRGTGYIDGGRKQITGWLYSALATNMPYDRFVRELVDPTSESEGFAKGIVWRGVVNASQTPQMQAAQNISQVFMGVNLKCASCHDSFINDWQLTDSYGLASIYSDQPLEMVLCDKPTGKIAAVRFLYPELGTIDSTASKSERLKQLANAMTSDRNGRLTGTIVNRLWAKFMGRGLVEPVDDMEQAAWNQDLLDWLASDLAANGYNLKRTMELILTSRAYQLPASPSSEQVAKDFVFRGPQMRRMSAEQIS
jgi:cytochrome c553